MIKVFDGKTVLVTGASDGIGWATARMFAREGARVVLSARRQELGEARAREIRSEGGEATFVQTDVTSSEDVQRMVARCIEVYGRLDCAFNNAGIGGAGLIPTADYPEQAWHEVIATNLTGMFLCMKYEIPELLKQPHPAIVNMSSVAGLVGGSIGSAYYASKHGVIGITKAAAIEYAAQGLRVNAVAPAVIMTDLSERAFFRDPAVAARVTASHPMGRVGVPEEVAAAVLWLCSDAASFVTGQALAIDGGRLAQ
jgi:NAD(P)-dependent dehydrogenase (short-subunit alcohol dehydrogenase family)